MRKIIINLDGGLVPSVHLIGLPDVQVEVRDRDIEGAEDDELATDILGQYVHTSPDIVAADL